MYVVIVERPTCSATWAKIVLIEYVMAVVSVCGPQLLSPSLLSGTPDTVTGESPLMTEFSVYIPLSIAAVAVTILKVEPGAYLPWVVRLTRQSGWPQPWPGSGPLSL